MASQPGSVALREQMLQECTAMARYALASGMPVSSSIADSIEAARLADPGQPATLAPLVKAHIQLSRLVAPATPRALLAMGDEHGGSGRLSWLGSVGLVRRLMGAAVASVLIFFVLSATDYTSGTGRVSFQNDTGLDMMVNQLFWISAAGIGASFAMLMQVNGYIVKRTYDPKYEPTYWIKFILGLMAGFILVALLPEVSSAESGAVTLPMLAMLGGFSASAVYRILAKLVESIEAVFRGSAAEEMAQRERAAQSRATEEVSQARLTVASQIVTLQQQLTSGKDPAQLSESLRGILATLVPGAPGSTLHDAVPPAAQDAAPAPPAVALPNTPIVSDAGVVQPPVAVAEEPAAVTAEPAAVSADAGAGEAGGSWTPPVEDESGGEAYQPTASTTATSDQDPSQTGPQG
ncbi:MAG TPA: hypothetical protein VGB15_21910 [Longimicrobium sp.]|jgi:hypothetical protein